MPTLTQTDKQASVACTFRCSGEFRKKVAIAAIKGSTSVQALCIKLIGDGLGIDENGDPLKRRRAEVA